ncbi:SPOSA6832_02519 [Sporobolomyces salmonicolor]|uniref:SPOSA6832_02519-mRNA-1:cds n=1 Tax=Sporidiobolus salmonicolor TaxID=5005 RepID=A0A0D6ELS3_SPOSA|nr:SPOSA6832_02519 [Sporobolomyces salmonicolor]
MLRPASTPLATCSRCLSTAATRIISTPHPALSLTPLFLSSDEQSLLLHHSLALLDSPSRTSSAGRKRRRTWLKAHPTWAPDSDRLRGFMDDEAYEFEQGHFDGVIRGYREMLVREGLWEQAAKDHTAARELARVLARAYALLPPPAPSPPAPSPASPLSPPPHLIVHLLHLSSTGSIQPHVDNLEAFGRTIVGVSLGGERIMRFKQVSGAPEGTMQGPAEFEVLVESGSAYVQQEPLRTHYTHEVLEGGSWEGRRVGGTQRLSIMLRDRLPLASPNAQ